MSAYIYFAILLFEKHKLSHFFKKYDIILKFSKIYKSKKYLFGGPRFESWYTQNTFKVETRSADTLTSQNETI